MSNIHSQWEERRKQGFLRYLLWDGIIKIGEPSAVMMQIVGVLFLRDEGQTFGQ